MCKIIGIEIMNVDSLIQISIMRFWVIIRNTTPLRSLHATQPQQHNMSMQCGGVAWRSGQCSVQYWAGNAILWESDILSGGGER